MIVILIIISIPIVLFLINALLEGIAFGDVSDWFYDKIDKIKSKS